jgi:GNAT superfamily N-acetyltransferase
MEVAIHPEAAVQLTAYTAVPATFLVASILDVAPSAGHFTLSERQVARPYVKDYDAIPGNSPRAWPARFQVGDWGFFSARLDGRWVGASAVAPDPSLAPGAGAGDCVLWDLRVAPDYRGRGIGQTLFSAVEKWARERGHSGLVAETQNVNAPACRLYERCGCFLVRVDSAAYPDMPDESRMLWRKQLGTVDRAAST